MKDTNIWDLRSNYEEDSSDPVNVEMLKRKIDQKIKELETKEDNKRNCIIKTLHKHEEIKEIYESRRSVLVFNMNAEFPHATRIEMPPDGILFEILVSVPPEMTTLIPIYLGNNSSLTCSIRRNGIIKISHMLYISEEELNSEILWLNFIKVNDAANTLKLCIRNLKDGVNDCEQTLYEEMLNDAKMFLEKSTSSSVSFFDELRSIMSNEKNDEDEFDMPFEIEESEESEENQNE